MLGLEMRTRRNHPAIPEVKGEFKTGTNDGKGEKEGG